MGVTTFSKSRPAASRDRATYDGTGIPLHSDNQSVIKERLYLDAEDPNIAHDEIMTFDHALTRPWTVVKNYFRNPDPRPNWTEEDCGENNHVLIGHEDYRKCKCAIRDPHASELFPRREGTNGTPLRSTRFHGRFGSGRRRSPRVTPRNKPRARGRRP
jgi:hypothetical protein